MLFHTLALLILLLLSACNLDATPTAIPITSTPPDTSTTPTESTQWQQVADGIEHRIYVPNDTELVQFSVLRIDPQKYRFRAIYQAGDPLRIAEWEQAEPNAVAIINANFFDPQHNVLGLLVSDGVVYGQSYTNRGGTFVVRDGVPSVRSNRRTPYQGEPLEQAVQAFPLLVEDGQATYFDASSNQLTRRTVIAQDSDGKILIMATPALGLSLADMSAYLPTTDMNIVTAFNLDGGGSTMMAIPTIDYYITSLDPVPAVLAVYPIND